MNGKEFSQVRRRSRYGNFTFTLSQGTSFRSFPKEGDLESYFEHQEWHQVLRDTLGRELMDTVK